MSVTSLPLATKGPAFETLRRALAVQRQELLVLAAASIGLAALLAIWMAPLSALLGSFALLGLLYVSGRALAPLVSSGGTRVLVSLMTGLVLLPLAFYTLVLARFASLPGLVLAAIALGGVGISVVIARAERSDAAARPRSRETGESPEVADVARGWWLLAILGGLLLAAAVRGSAPAWSSAFVLVVTAAVGALAYLEVRRDHSTDGEDPKPFLAAGLAGVGFVILLAVLLLPFLDSASPLGYDTGIYRGLQREFAAALPSYPAFATGDIGETEPVGLYLVTDLLHLIGWNADASLFALLVIGQLLIAAGAWLVVRDIAGRYAAGVAVLLVALSATQFETYWYAYQKQVLATGLLLFLVWTWRRESVLAVAVGALLAGTHHLTFLLAGLMLATDIVVRFFARPGERRAVVRQAAMAAGMVLGGLALYIPTPEAVLQPLRELMGGSVVGSPGEFFGPLTVARFIERGLFLIPLAIVGATVFRRDRSVQLLTYAAAWVLVMASLESMAYRRFLLHLDVLLICLAAPSVVLLVRMAGTAAGTRAAAVAGVGGVFLLSGALLWSAYTLGAVVTERGPQVPAEEFAAIEAIDAGTPAGATVVTPSSQVAPWLYGYSERLVVAENLFADDRWSADEWQALWSADATTRAQLLAEYPQPVYFFVPPSQAALATALFEDPALVPAGAFLWRYGAAH